MPLSLPPMYLRVRSETTPVVAAVIATSWILSYWLCLRGGSVDLEAPMLI